MDYRLEPYSGRLSRHICPRCGKREFVRYISESGEYLASDVGRCNRESKCEYHKPPRDYFAEQGVSFSTNRRAFKPSIKDVDSRIDFIERNLMEKTLEAHQCNGLFQFLNKQLGLDSAQVSETFLRYHVGSSSNGRTVFWQTDINGGVRSGKLIRYDQETGHRIKACGVSWVHSEMKTKSLIADDFSFQQCLFGEHLLPQYPNSRIGIVESEKTALICSLLLDGFDSTLWLATGGKSNLSARKLQHLQGRKIVLLPDGDGFWEWSESRDSISKHLPDTPIIVSTALQNMIPEEKKSEGFDLADHLCGLLMERA